VVAQTLAQSWWTSSPFGSFWVNVLASCAFAAAGALGGYMKRDGIANMLDWLMWWNNRRHKALRRIIAKNTLHFTSPKTIGYISKMPILKFVDILSAMNQPEYQQSLVGILVGLYKRESIQRPDKVAVSKLGNVPLAAAFARRLRLPLVVLRHKRNL
jgi:hypothetical protein